MLWPHALRHSCATHLLAERFTLKDIAEHLATSPWNLHRYMPRPTGRVARSWSVDLSAWLPIPSTVLYCHTDLSQRQHRSASGVAAITLEDYYDTVTVVESYIAYKRSLGKDFKSKAVKLRAL